ncbi:MAG: hypothetical protein AB9835_02765 [Eubacteriales bacterium]
MWKLENISAPIAVSQPHTTAAARSASIYKAASVRTAPVTTTVSVKEHFNSPFSDNG